MDNSNGIGVTPASHVMPGQTNITKDEWRQKYWFNSLQMVTVVNPKPEAWDFMVEMRNYTIGAGTHERFPGIIANVYLDQMSKILAQDDDRLGFMTDPNLMKIYYDQLIVDVEDLVNQASSIPAYLQMPARPATPVAERAPWDASIGERATDVAPNAAPVSSFPEAKPQQPEVTTVVPSPEEEKESNFDYDGNKYKMVLAKNGTKMYFKDGRRTDVGEFNKAASML